MRILYRNIRSYRIWETEIAGEDAFECMVAFARGLKTPGNIEIIGCIPDEGKFVPASDGYMCNAKGIIRIDDELIKKANEPKVLRLSLRKSWFIDSTPHIAVNGPDMPEELIEEGPWILHRVDTQLGAHRWEFSRGWPDSEDCFAENVKPVKSDLSLPTDVSTPRGPVRVAVRKKVLRVVELKAS